MNEKKSKKVKVFKVDFKVLSHSTLNLCTLLEVKINRRKHHALRLFCTCKLYSPMLGDNYTSSRIQDIQGIALSVPFIDKVTTQMSKLNKTLLELLMLTPRQQEIIPVHVHMRELILYGFPMKNQKLVLTAPLLPPFDWTCEQLKLDIPTTTEACISELPKLRNSVSKKM